MHFTTQCRVTVFLVLLVVFSLNVTFWVQDAGSRHCATVGHWKDFKWRSELAECSLHEFTVTDMLTCLHGQRIAFIGDKRMKELFLFFAFSVTDEPRVARDNLVGTPPILLVAWLLLQHSSVKLDSLDITMDYYEHIMIDDGIDDLYQNWRLGNGGPQLVLHNGCSWILGRRDTMSQVLSSTTHNISRLISSQQDFLSVHQASEIYWLPQDSLLIDKLWGRARKSANKHIWACDKAIRHAYIGSAVHYMDHLVTLAAERPPPQRNVDVAVYQNSTLKAKLDVVLSSHCSSSLPDPKLSPDCCISPQPGQWLLVLMVLSVAMYLGSSLIVATNTLTGLQPFIQASKQSGFIPLSNQRLSVIHQVSSSAMGLIAILLFVYVCDRTFLFVKTDKIASLPIFLLLLACSVLGGTLTLNESDEYGFFDEQQVDEFKGLAVLFILCYSYMAPVIQQRAFPLAVHQLSVGLYLFVDSYDVFVTCRNNKGYRINRLVERLVQLNLFPFLLGLLVKTSYSVYYLAPILSLSCILTYLMISTRPRIIDFGYKSPLIITKLAVIAIILWFLPPINSLIRTRQEAWKAIFTLIDDNKFVPLLGMLVGYVTCRAKDAEWSIHNLSTRLQVMFKVVLLLASLLTLALMVAISQYQLSFITFLALAFLRNFHSSIQKYNSNFLQIAGILSYELFLLHFHIWTGYHGSALLLMTPEIELVNFLVATLVLATVTDYLNTATQSLLYIYCNS